MPDDKQKQFFDTIMSISAPTNNVFGTGSPAMLNSASTSSTVVVQLKKDTIALFAHQGQQQTYAKAVEGGLLALETLSVLDEKQTDNLIDTLHSLITG